jgi:hypothetical protein
MLSRLPSVENTYPVGLVSQNFRAGNLDLPQMVRHSARLDWDPIRARAAEVVSDLESRATGRFIDEGVLRFVTCTVLTEQGVDPASLFLDERSTEVGAVELTIGLTPAASLGFLALPAQNTTAEAQRVAWMKLLTSIARLATVTEGERGLVVFASVDVVERLWAIETGVPKVVGSRTIEQLGLEDPLKTFWETEILRPGIEPQTPGRSLYFLTVGKLR